MEASEQHASGLRKSGTAPMKSLKLAENGVYSEGRAVKRCGTCAGSYRTAKGCGVKLSNLAVLSLAALGLALLLAVSAQAGPADRADGTRRCSFCNGSGIDPQTPWRRFMSQPCRHCRGTGLALVPLPLGEGWGEGRSSQRGAGIVPPEIREAVYVSEFA